MKKTSSEQLKLFYRENKSFCITMLILFAIGMFFGLPSLADLAG